MIKKNLTMLRRTCCVFFLSSLHSFCIIFEVFLHPLSRTQEVPAAVLCAQAGFHHDATGRGWDPRYVEAALLKQCPPGSAEHVRIAYLYLSTLIEPLLNPIPFYASPRVVII
jgi:hypothetical protein